MPHARAIKLLSFLFFLIPLSAFAVLGQTESSVSSDQAHLQATRRIVRGAAYTVHEMQAASGAVIREYVAPSGSVFAIAWQGPSHPDMQQLLGTYFEQYRQVMQSRGPGRAPVVVQVPGLVIESSGRMRAFAGRVYVPQMVPQGVRAEEIR